MEVHQGDPASLLATICAVTDIVVVPPPGRPTEHALGIHARRSLAMYHCAASVMAFPSAVAVPRGPIAVAVQSSDDESLSVAARIASRAGEELVVLAPAEIHAELREILGRHSHIRMLAGQTGQAILAALRGLETRLFVMTRGTAHPDADSTLRDIAEGGHVPVLMLEPPQA